MFPLLCMNLFPTISTSQSVHTEGVPFTGRNPISSQPLKISKVCFEQDQRLVGEFNYEEYAFRTIYNVFGGEFLGSDVSRFDET